VDEFSVEKDSEMTYQPEEVDVSPISNTDIHCHPHYSVSDKAKKWMHIISNLRAKHLQERIP
jgi:hypothetical protein